MQMTMPCNTSSISFFSFVQPDFTMFLLKLYSISALSRFRPPLLHEQKSPIVLQIGQDAKDTPDLPLKSGKRKMHFMATFGEVFECGQHSSHQCNVMGLRKMHTLNMDTTNDAICGSWCFVCHIIFLFWLFWIVFIFQFCLECHFIFFSLFCHVCDP